MSLKTTHIHWPDLMCTNSKLAQNPLLPGLWRELWLNSLRSKSPINIDLDDTYHHITANTFVFVRKRNLIVLTDTHIMNTRGRWISQLSEVPIHNIKAHLWKAFAIFYFPRERIMLQALFLMHILCCNMGQGLFESLLRCAMTLWVEAENLPCSRFSIHNPSSNRSLFLSDSLFFIPSDSLRLGRSAVTHYLACFSNLQPLVSL